MQFTAFNVSLAVTAVVLTASVATAQVVTTVPTDTYLAVVTPGPCTGGGLGGAGNCISPSLGIPLSALTGFNYQPQINALSDRLAFFNSEISRLCEITSIAAAMGDAIPNPGDRFAFRIHAAGIDGAAGGALGLSYQVTDAARLSLNYGRGRTQTVESGGLSLSFR